MTRESVMKRRFWTEIFEKFPFSGHLPSKPQTWSGSNRHLTQSRLQVKRCTAERYCLLYVVVQGPESFRGRSTFRRTYVYGATGRQNFQIFGCWPIFPIQNAEKVPPGDQPTAAQGLHRMQNDSESYVRNLWWIARQVLHRRMIPIFRVIVEGPKGAFWQWSFPATSDRGAGDPQTCPNFRLWQMAVPQLLHGASDRRRATDDWKRAILRTDVPFHQISSPLPPKSPKSPF